MKRISILILVLAFLSCGESSKELTAEEIVNRAIDKAGGELYQKAQIDFRFRNMTYRSQRDGGAYQLERRSQDSLGNLIVDVLKNEGFNRYRNDSLVQLPDSLQTAYSNSVNSVHYFVHLPFGLNAPAANKELIGKDSIGSREYYEIMVTFSENGGGTDHEDEYMYWIDTQSFEVDYLAYNFETNDGGIRFRRAINPRVINGIRFVDYENYKYEDLSAPLKDLDSLYENRQLDLLSMIETKDVEVDLGS
ncbi:deoxyribose-phosphate aldolase [Gramella sp. BOM4]|nr:deoxyribose-phosphate aldolase [Christiangramia bathymodioli]